MKRKLKVYYADINNMGDQLNVAIINKCFGYEVQNASCLNAEMSGIGSCLGQYTYGDSVKRNLKKFISGIIYPKAYIWGTGFLEYNKNKLEFYKRNINFCAVRGELSKKAIEDSINEKLNIPTADGGILASFLLDNQPEKKFDVGIISHFREKDNKIFRELQEKFKNSVLIDVQDDPISVTQKIAECKTILSSSLHGLIIADSLNIPNLHIIVTDNLLGDGFKFDDYYSAYGLKHYYKNLNEEQVNNIEEIIDNYKITKEMVDQKKKDMIECFPFK